MYCVPKTFVKRLDMLVQPKKGDTVVPVGELNEYSGLVQQRTEKGWREVLVDIDPEVPDQLRFVLSPSRTPATQNFIQVRLCLPELVLTPLLTLSSTFSTSQLLCQQEEGSQSINE